MKFGEVPRRPETRRATVDGLCESLKEFRRGQRVAAAPLPGRRAAGCSGEPPPGRGGQWGAWEPAVRRVPGRRRSAIASPPPMIVVVVS